MRRALIPQVIEPSYMDYGYGYNQMLNVSESPETAIARSIPHSAIRLLDRESKRKHYVAALSIGAGVVNTYLNRLPSEEHTGLSKIRIEPEKLTRGIIGLCLGSKGREITFERKRK